VALVGESCVARDLSKGLLGKAEFAHGKVDSQPAKIFADCAPMKLPENPREMHHMHSGHFSDFRQGEIVRHGFMQQFLNPTKPGRSLLAAWQGYITSRLPEDL